MAGKRSPWGKPNGGNGGNDGEGGPESGGETSSGGDQPSSGPRNPWLPGGGSDGDSGDGTPSDRGRRSASIEDIFKNRGPEGPRRAGGGGGGTNFRMPQRPGGKSWLPLVLVAVAAIWLFASSVHFVQPREQGVVTWFGGKFSDTLDPGTNITMPWPIQMVDIENVSQIRSEEIPGDANEKLILTSDQNLVDLSYLIRWNITDLSLYRYQLADPNDTMREVAEATMRAAVAEQELDTVLTGSGRAEIEQRVLSSMQGILDAYRSGIAIQGIEINKTDPPARVEEAFKDVSSAQQDADAAMNRARADAQQWLNRAQGDAAEFNNIYAEYRLAPEVTRRRLYYETMESVLANTDKTIVEADGVTPYLPLPELRRRSNEAASAPAPTTTVTGGQ